MADLRVNDNAYINIQAFMVNELHLSGNELIIFAAIFGFSQDGESWFTGSRAYLAAWCQTSKQTISNNLAKLVDKGFIEKRVRNENGVTLCDYRVGKKFIGVDKKFVGGSQKIYTGGRQKICPHTIEVDNLEEKIERDIERNAIYGIEESKESDSLSAESSQGSGFSAQPYTASSTAQAETPTRSKAEAMGRQQPATPNRSGQGTERKKAKEPRHRYGAYGNVLLGDTDLAKLKAEFPSDWQERVERLSEYMESTGKSYKNHLATIRNWARRDKASTSGGLSNSKPPYVAQGNQGWALPIRDGQTAAEAQREYYAAIQRKNAERVWTEEEEAAFTAMGI